MGEGKDHAGGLAQETVSLSPEGAGASSASLPSPGWRRRLVRWVFHRWFRLTRAMTLGVRAVVLDGEGRVFLVRHSYVPGWHLPGGGVEPGQSLLQALAMELEEEAHIRLAGEAVLFGVYQNRDAAPRDHVALFVVRAFVQERPRLPDREIVEAGFFALDALPAATTAATRRRLVEVLSGGAPAEHW